MTRGAGSAGEGMRVVFHDGSMGWAGETRACLAAGMALSRRGYNVAFAAPAGSPLAHAAAAVGGAVFALQPDAGMLRQVRELRQVLRTHAAEALVVQHSGAHLAGALAARSIPRLLLVRRIPAGGARPDDRYTRFATRLRPITYIHTEPVEASASGSDGTLRVVLGVSLTDRWTSETGGQQSARLSCLAADDHGSLEPWLRAAAMLVERHPQLRLVVHGVHRERDTLRILSAALGLSTRVEWAGERPGAGAGEALSDADLVWVAADSGDAGAFACLDAMGRGIPVLARRTDVTARHVEAGREGELFARLEPALIAAATERLWGAPDRRAALGRAARGRVDQEFTERAMATSFERVLRAAGEPKIG